MKKYNNKLIYIINIYIYIYIQLTDLFSLLYKDFTISEHVYNIIILINNSRRKDKGNQWHDGGCISDTKFC